MPFAFSSIEPRQTGQLNNPGVDIGRYLEQTAEQGINDSVFSVVQRMVEDQIYKEGPIMQPDELNKRYGIKGELNFDKPEYEAIANLRNNRKRKELERSYYLEQGSKGFFSGRGAAGLGVGMLASMANPLDLGLAFLPVTGSLARAKQLESAGAAGIRVALAKGLITEEAMVASKIPAPKFFSSMIDGTVSQAAVEIPLAYQNYKDQANYGIGDFATNILMGGAFAGAINLTGKLLEPVFRKLKEASPEARETMFRQAIQQALRDEDIRVHEYVKLDDAAIHLQAERELGLQAERNINMKKLQEEVLAKFDERIVGAAFKDEKGEIHGPAPMHGMIPEYESWLDRGGIANEAGFLTDAGRFVSREEAAAIGGYQNKQLDSTDSSASNIHELVGAEFNYAKSLVEKGMSEEAAFASVIEQRDIRAVQNKLNSPAVQEAIAQEKQRRINEWVEANKPEAVSKIAEMEIKRQIEAGKTLSPEDLKKWEFDLDEGGKAAIDEQSAALDAEVKSMIEDLGDEAVDVLERLKIPITGPMEGVTGTPIWLWNGAITATQVAIRAGQKVAEAIEAGVKYLYENWHGKPLTADDVKYENFQEGFQVPGGKKIEGFHMVTLKKTLSEDLVEGSTVSVKSLNKAGYQIEGGIIPGTQKFEKAGMDRRGFLGTMSKALAAAQLPIPKAVVDAAGSLPASKLPSITIRDLLNKVGEAHWDTATSGKNLPKGLKFFEAEEDTGTNQWIRKLIRTTPEYKKRVKERLNDPEWQKKYVYDWRGLTPEKILKQTQSSVDHEFNPDSWSNDADLTIFKKFTETPINELISTGALPPSFVPKLLKRIDEFNEGWKTYKTLEAAGEYKEAGNWGEGDDILDNPEGGGRFIEDESDVPDTTDPQTEADALAQHFRQTVGEEIKKIEEARKQELKDLKDEIKKAEAEAMNSEAIAQALNCLIRKG